MKIKVLEIIKSIVKKTIEELEANFTNPNFLDSLEKVEIVLSIEEEFNVFFEPEELSSINSIESIIKIIEEKI